MTLVERELLVCLAQFKWSQRHDCILKDEYSYNYYQGRSSPEPMKHSPFSEHGSKKSRTNSQNGLFFPIFAFPTSISEIFYTFHPIFAKKLCLCLFFEQFIFPPTTTISP